MYANVILMHHEIPNHSSLQTNTDAFAKSVDPDEMARIEASHLDIHSLPLCY